MEASQENQDGQTQDQAQDSQQEPQQDSQLQTPQADQPVPTEAERVENQDSPPVEAAPARVPDQERYDQRESERDAARDLHNERTAAGVPRPTEAEVQAEREQDQS